MPHEVYNRCACDWKALSGRHRGLFLKKPRTITVSCAELGRPFPGRLCDGMHQHLEGDEHPKELAEAQVWTGTVACLLMDGVGEVRDRAKRGDSLYEADAYPTVSSSTDLGPSRGGPADETPTSAPSQPKGRPKSVKLIQVRLPLRILLKHLSQAVIIEHHLRKTVIAQVATGSELATIGNIIELSAIARTPLINL